MEKSAETTEEVVECAETTEEVVECAETTEEVVECAETTEEVAVPPQGSMSLGEMRFGITCTGEPIRHFTLAVRLFCMWGYGHGSSVLSNDCWAKQRGGRGGVAVDMNMFLDSVIEGAGRLAGLAGISEAASLPAWAVSRLMGTFPALMSVYHEAIDQSILMVEAAAIKAAIGMKLTNTRKVTKTDEDGRKSSTSETLNREIMPDPALSKLLLTNRMKSRYNDTEDVKQAVQINVYGPEADL